MRTTPEPVANHRGLSASRQSNELPANATIANKVSSKVRLHNIRDSISEEIDNGKLSFSYDVM